MSPRIRPIGLLLAGAVAMPGLEVHGELAGEWRAYLEEADDDRQDHDQVASVSGELELRQDWAEGRHELQLRAFARWDRVDPERTHGDLRQACWRHLGEGHELVIGIDQVFWGVTESQHLVDVINQVDLVEDIDGEEKLGQPMLRLGLFGEWGALDAFLLVGFRPRSFPGIAGRLRYAPPVIADRPLYAGDADESDLGGALRWAHNLGPWDVGLSWFHGVGRDPRYAVELDAELGVVLRPVYDTVDQFGLDLQLTWGQLLGKCELIHRRGQEDPFTAATVGGEYTVVGVVGSDLDLGLLVEYLYDERDEAAPTPFTHDLYLATRWVLNDVQSTTLLAGVIVDLESGAQTWRAEASRRIGADWRLDLEGGLFVDVPDEDLLAGMRDDDYLEMTLTLFF